MATTAETIAQQSLAASYAEVQEALTQKTIPDWFIQDYINKQQNINTIAGSTSTLEEQVALNVINIQTNAGNIDNHINDATDAHAGTAISYNNTSSGLSAINSQDAIDEVDSNLDSHISNATGAHAATSISYSNATSGLSAVNAQAAIDEVDANLDNHESDTSAHGVTGVNIGAEDYAQTLVGGAVLLAIKVADATQTSVAIVTADVGAAPVVYDQTYAQSQTDLINENKATINNLVTDVSTLTTQLNAFLSAVQTAKQMSTI